MTGPLVASSEWPEWADRHCWDEDGCGEFYGVLAQDGAWTPVYEYSNMPLPAGHDWRVPVMRPQPIPTLDLEKFRKPVEAWKREAERLHHAGKIFPQTEDAIWAEAGRLLAVIDGSPKGGIEARDEALNTLARMFHNGEEMEGPDGMAVSVDLALWHEATEAFDVLIGDYDAETLATSTEAQPTKGEGAADE